MLPKHIVYFNFYAPTISKVFEMLPDIDDKELLAVGESVVNKLGEMSDEDFSECHFNEMFSD